MERRTEACENVETMHLTFRLASTRDLAWCSSILDDGFENRPELHSKLPDIWKELLEQDALFMAVLEDQDRSNQLVAFGATTFISDRFLAEALSNPKPHLAVQLLEREAMRRNRAISRPDETRKQSMENGLNLLILHYSEVVDPYSQDERDIIRDTMVFGLLETHRGHNLKHLLYEFYGEHDLPFILESGATLVTDFKDWYRSKGLCIPEPHRHPYLVVVNHDIKRQRRGSWMSWLFYSSKTRLRFSPAEQKIATRALAGETDAQLAHNPEISPNTVRRHWRSMFKKVEAAGITLIPPELIEQEKKVRLFTGHKKKRPFLLNYLRQHPEELRPHATGKAKAAAAE